MFLAHSKHSEAFCRQLVKGGQRRRALQYINLTSSGFNRHHGGHFSDSPIAYDKPFWILLAEPALNAARHLFIEEHRDNQRCVEIEHQ